MENQSLTNMANLIEAVDNLFLDYMNNCNSISEFAAKHGATENEAIYIISMGIELMKDAK